jgi:hypothetical protein
MPFYLIYKCLFYLTGEQQKDETWGEENFLAWR